MPFSNMILNFFFISGNMTHKCLVPPSLLPSGLSRFQSETCCHHESENADAVAPSMERPSYKEINDMIEGLHVLVSIQTMCVCVRASVHACVCVCAVCKHAVWSVKVS